MYVVGMYYGTVSDLKHVIGGVGGMFGRMDVDGCG